MSALQQLRRTEPRFERFAVVLQEAGLPTDDLDGASRFFVLSSDAEAFGGLEGSGPDQLIRSVVVSRSSRGRGLGGQIVEALVSQARTDGVERLWLLTTSADRFFADLGWTVAERAAAPEAVRATRQFAGLCPASAVLMCRRLA